MAKKSKQPPAPPVGATQDFVLAQGFREFKGKTALIGNDGTLRLFMEITADPDRPNVNPAGAWYALLTALAPGGTIRLLQIRWPDPQPRQEFVEQMNSWQAGQEAMSMLLEGIRLFARREPLPYIRRTILEFVALNTESLSWWDGVQRIIGDYGLVCHYLSADEVEAMAHWILNPDVK